MRMALLLLCWLPASFVVVASPSSAQELFQSSKLFSAADWQHDFSILKRAYDELHPGLLRYHTREQMNGLWAGLQQELNHDLTREQGYLAISIYLARIKCGHTYANFYNQPKEIVSELLMRGGRVPFYFRWIDRRMIVTRSFVKETGLQPGSEILEINGKPVGTILEKLLTIARADGSNDAKRIDYLEVQGLNRFDAFDVYFPLFFPSVSPTIQLKVQPVGGQQSVSIKVPSLSQAERMKQMDQDSKNKSKQTTTPWEVRYFEKTAYLKMSSWALYNDKWDWQNFLDQSFNQLIERRTPHLILDLRGNEGGLSVGNAIISRLITQPLTLPQYARKVRYKSVPADLVPYLDTWDKSFRDWGDAAVEPKYGFYRLKRDVDTKAGSEIQPKGPRYSGQVYVLVDASNSSATFEFALIAQQNKLVTLVGAPTGGNQRGINGGAFFFLRLPKTGIEVDLPLIGQFTKKDMPDAGLQPDVLVKPRMEDIARGVDTELEAVLGMIREK